MVIFFTLPPSSIDYPYVLINANKPETGISYIVMHRRAVEIVIIDSGIEIFRDPHVRDYPGGAEAWIRKLVHLHDRVRSILGRGARIYVTCPDYPDDYRPGALWLSNDLTNIERSVLNVLKCVDWYDDIDWLIPVQGWYRRPPTLLWSLEYLDQLGILERYEYLAVANLSTDTSVRIVKDSVLYVHSWLRKRYGDRHRIHIFALGTSALKHVLHKISSFDRTSWTRPVSARLHDVFPWSAKTEAERILFFAEYLVHLHRYGVAIPPSTAKQCIERLEQVGRFLVNRYPLKRDKVLRLLDAMRSDLETIIR